MAPDSVFMHIVQCPCLQLALDYYCHALHLSVIHFTDT